jgi:hypothetical protein
MSFEVLNTLTTPRVNERGESIFTNKCLLEFESKIEKGYKRLCKGPMQNRCIQKKTKNPGASSNVPLNA